MNKYWAKKRLRDESNFLGELANLGFVKKRMRITILVGYRWAVGISVPSITTSGDGKGSRVRMHRLTTEIGFCVWLSEMPSMTLILLPWLAIPRYSKWLEMCHVSFYANAIAGSLSSSLMLCSLRAPQLACCGALRMNLFRVVLLCITLGYFSGRSDLLKSFMAFGRMPLPDVRCNAVAYIVEPYGVPERAYGNNGHAAYRHNLMGFRQTTKFFTSITS